VVALFLWTALASVVIAAWSYFRSRLKSYPVRVVGQAGEIPVGGSKIFTYPTDVEPCLLLRPAQETYLAFSRTCTHAACPVFYQPADNLLSCPCHQGVYSAADGSVVSGPPPRPLPRVVLERRGPNLVATGMKS
jgi:nitrite reductase/ring-hydroxylating ferredoxin subunit